MNDSQRSKPLDTGVLFRQVFEMRLAFLAVLDRAGTVIEINRAPLRLGLAREDFLGRHIGETPSFASDAGWVATWDARLAETAAAGTPSNYEDLFTGPSGESRSADATLSPVRGDDGEVDHFLLEAEDTTDRLQVELALRDSERRFHDLAESIPVMCWSTDAAGSCDYLNQRWLEYTGVTPGSHLGWAWIEAVHPDDRPALGERWTAALRDAHPVHTEYRLRSADGDYRWFDIRVVPVFGGDGAAVRWYGTGADIHEARELRQSLQEREAQLTAALQAGAMARFTYDVARREFTADPFLGEIIGLASSDLADAGLEGFLRFVHEDDRVRMQQTIRGAFDPATPDWSIEYRLQLPDAPVRWIGARGHAVFDEAGKPLSLTGVVQALPGSAAQAPGIDALGTAPVVDPRD